MSAPQSPAPIAVVAVGGNALSLEGAPDTIEEQYRATAALCTQLGGLLTEGYRLVLCHGNGPQVGKAVLRVEATPYLTRLPLDICVADTEGGIGYMIQQVLGNTLGAGSTGFAGAITVITQVRVAPEDPAFARPTKPIGPFYTAEEAEEKRQTLGWTIVEDSGRGFRRVVPSPQPCEIVELAGIRALVDSGYIPVACGGGGVPVVREADGRLRGVSAVIDKDRAAALLARGLDAELLILCTGVPIVFLDYGRPSERPLHRVDAAAARRYLEEGQFPPGSMGPKIEAALDFLAGGGREVLITTPAALGEARAGRSGTRIVP